MDSRRDQLKLLEHFTKTLKADKARPQIAQLSELGLVELTRKRQGKNIYELFGQICPSCGGLGHLAHLPGKPEGESLESPPITPPAIVPSIPDKYNQDNELTDSSLDYGYYSTPQQLELINHPSYQEQGGVSGTNRRRRRRRLNEVLMKEELGNGDGLTTREVDRESNHYEERKSRPSSNRSSRREEVTLEKVAVEMSNLEQEMYALMGVSPLIRLEREFKDPKSVLIQIKSPGEENVVESTESKSTISLNSTKVEVEDTKSNVEVNNVALQNTNADESLDDNDDVNNGRRRRRRRSSAQKEVEAQV